MTLYNRETERQLVEVVFDDPAEFDTNYDTKLEPIECRAIGWLDEKTPNYLRISWLKESDNTPYVGLAIPTGCVKRVVEFVANKIVKEREFGK